MKYAIIGNSTAAIGAIEGIRQVDSDGEITVISKEIYHTYSRPLISYLLNGKTDEQKMRYRDDGVYTKMNGHPILGNAVIPLDDNLQQVILDDDTTVRYDKLLVATGSRSFVPPLEGLESVKKQTTFMSLDDAKSLESMITLASKVLIIGAGLIGLKCAEGISKKVDKITVVDIADRILSSILDDEGAKKVQEHMEKQNIEFILNTGVEKFYKNTAILSNGEQISFDVLVLALGVRPNVDLIKSIGGKVQSGIVANELQETTIPNVYAAGDCCESFDISKEEKRVLALLPNAYMQGECAGINMAGGKKIYGKAIPMNAISFFGLHIITAGSYEEEIYTRNDVIYKKLFVKDGVLKGYILIGNVEKAGIYTSLIREKIPIEDIDFELICKAPGLMAFSKAERSKKLGGIILEY